MFKKIFLILLLYPCILKADVGCNIGSRVYTVQTGTVNYGYLVPTYGGPFYNVRYYPQAPYPGVDQNSMQSVFPNQCYVDGQGGSLVNYTVNNGPGNTNVPLDDYILILIIVALGIGLYKLKST